MKRLHLYLSGYVQGVGFRWYAEKIARRVGGVTGFVRNLNDGRVEIVVEGKEEIVTQFLRELETGYLGSKIDNIEKIYEPCTGKFPDFSIAF